MEIRVLKDSISRKELAKIAESGFGDMVKAVVDVGQGIMAIGGELHADIEVLLMEEKQSKREHTWGINLYPKKIGNDFIEFDSMINLKPAQGNRTRGVESLEVQTEIRKIVMTLIYD